MSSFLLISCEGYRTAKGVIYDSQTSLPIDSVRCKVLLNSLIQYSDSLGNYSVHNKIGSCIFGCADIEVEYSKAEYKTKIINNGDTIYLEKE